MAHLTLSDRKEMRTLGNTTRAWFINPMGVPFHKDFPNGEQMEEFISRAAKAGSKLTGFASLPETAKQGG